MTKPATKTEFPVDLQCHTARLYEALWTTKCPEPAAWEAVAALLEAASPHAYYQDRARDARNEAKRLVAMAGYRSL